MEWRVQLISPIQFNANHWGAPVLIALSSTKWSNFFFFLVFFFVSLLVLLFATNITNYVTISLGLWSGSIDFNWTTSNWNFLCVVLRLSLTSFCFTFYFSVLCGGELWNWHNFNKYESARWRWSIICLLLERRSRQNAKIYTEIRD